MAADPDLSQAPIEIPAGGSDADTGVAVVATDQPEPAKVATETVVTAAPSAVPGTEAIGKTDLDDAKDLRDLFKNLGSA